MIYIVEDDDNIRELESYALKNSGYDVIGLDNGKELYALCDKRVPALIILDIMLPNEDGLSILRKLRERTATKSVPIIMVTAKGTELDKVKGLDMGADDYLTKPFGIMELVSRVKALLRRSGALEPDLLYQYDGVRLEDDKHQVSVDGQPIELTYKEYELLKYLLANKEIVLSRDKLMNKVWGFEFEGESRTVDMHVKTLRQKLLDKGSIIKTVRNVGYKIGT